MKYLFPKTLIILIPAMLWFIPIANGQQENWEEIFFKACRRRTGVRAMRVWFRDFSRSPAQLSLFPEKSHEDERESRITYALDSIRARHGENFIRYGRGV